MTKVNRELSEISSLSNNVSTGAEEVSDMVSEQSTASQIIAHSMEELTVLGESTANQMAIASTIAVDLEHVATRMTASLDKFKV